MKTSYFAKYKESNSVSIALKSPNWFHGESYPALFPTWEIINKHKQRPNNKNRKIIYIHEYYDQILIKLNPEDVYSDLKDKVLLCWEAPNKFCHRNIVARWIEYKLNVKVPEIGFEYD